MLPRRILRVLLAGLLAGSALLAPVPLILNPSFDPGPWTPYPPSAHADGPGDWPMCGHDPAHTGYLDAGSTIKIGKSWQMAAEGSEA